MPNKKPRIEVTQPTTLPYRFIALPHGRVTIVDEADYADLLKHSWCVGTSGYAATTLYGLEGEKTTFSLHRYLLDAPHGLCVDHINGDKLENRRTNLRLATYSQNNTNTKRTCRKSVTGLLGVSQLGKRYLARITRDRITHSLGTFDTAEEAHQAYVEAAQRLFGQYTRNTGPANFQPQAA